MPNWCSNYLTVTGPSASLDELIEGTVHESDVSTAGGPETVVDFSFVVPDPPEADDGSFDVCSWRVAHWGTKWVGGLWNGAYLPEDRDAGQVTVNFDTAWSPPLEWAAAAAERWPDLTIDLLFSEEGNVVFGRFGAQGTACSVDAPDTSNPLGLLDWLESNDLPSAAESARRWAAGDPSVDPARLAGFADDDDPEVRAAVAANPACPPETLAALADDDDPEVRAAVAGNPTCPPSMRSHVGLLAG